MQPQQPTLEEEFTQALRTVPDFPKAGIIFKDITPVFMQPLLCSRLILRLKELVSHLQIDAIAGIETRGYLFGFTLAQAMNIPFVIIRKAGKLPGAVHKKEYDLEYGKAAIEIQQGLVEKGKRVLIHDDLLATGGTAMAAAGLIRDVGADVVGFLFLIELKELGGKKKLETCSNSEVVSLVGF